MLRKLHNFSSGVSLSLACVNKDPIKKLIKVDSQLYVTAAPLLHACCHEKPFFIVWPFQDAAILPSLTAFLNFAMHSRRD